MREGAPEGALVARIGGEEFALLAGTGVELSGETVLARVRAERMPFDLTVTISLGSCGGPLGTEIEWKTLYRQALRERAWWQARPVPALTMLGVILDIVQRRLPA